MSAGDWSADYGVGAPRECHTPGVRPGPARGEVATSEVTVTPDMAARIGGREIHPAYGTLAMVRHVEELCRSLLEPHLEDDEEGVGYRLEVVHHAPAPVGSQLVLTATVADVGPKRLLCEVSVRRGNVLIAQASFEQRVVPAAEFTAQL